MWDYGKAGEVWQARLRVMQEVYVREPERFIRGIPKVLMLPRKAWINKPDEPQTVAKFVAARNGRQFHNNVLKRDQYQAV